MELKLNYQSIALTETLQLQHTKNLAENNTLAKALRTSEQKQ